MTLLCFNPVTVQFTWRIQKSCNTNGLLVYALYEYKYIMTCCLGRMLCGARQIVFLTFDKSQCNTRHSDFPNGLTGYVKKQPVAWIDCSVVYWYKKVRKHICRKLAAAICLKTCWNRRFMSIIFCVWPFSSILPNLKAAILKHHTKAPQYILKLYIFFFLWFHHQLNTFIQCFQKYANICSL